MCDHVACSVLGPSRNPCVGMTQANRQSDESCSVVEDLYAWVHRNWSREHHIQYGDQAVEGINRNVVDVKHYDPEVVSDVDPISR